MLLINFGVFSKDLCSWTDVWILVGKMVRKRTDRRITSSHALKKGYEYKDIYQDQKYRAPFWPFFTFCVLAIYEPEGLKEHAALMVPKLLRY